MPASIVPDFHFIAMRRGKSASDRRVNGFFVIPQAGFYCRACSGSSGLQPLPSGYYMSTNFRERKDVAMVRSGVGFSVDLADKWDPALKRMRSLLRIHPDGNAPGTQGCVGILDKVQECKDQLAALFPNGNTVRWLEVQIVAHKSEMNLITGYGAWFFA
jgi:hypothetical protein